MDNNLIYTTNYLRNNIIPDSKKTATQINKNIDNNTQDETYNNKFIMNRGLTDKSSNKQLDIKRQNIDTKDLSSSFRISRINIDSRHRNLESKNILDTQIYFH